MEQYLPSVKEIIEKYPLGSREKEFIDYSRTTSKKIFLKQENKIALFVGPCSFHHEEQLIDYAQNLKRIMTYASRNIFIIMRFFPEKSRTSLGWKGFLYDPFLDGTNNIHEGIVRTRKLMIKLTEIGIPLCTEMLDPLTSNYFQDLITWGFIGSRTVTSQIHRQLASSVPFCIGLKNCGCGNLKTVINSIMVSRSAHSFINIAVNNVPYIHHSQGNLFSHITLRGSENSINYDQKSILDLNNLMKQHNIYSPLVIDCAHGNSQKSIEMQQKCFEHAITRAKNDSQIIGVMFESFLLDGCQKFSSKESLKYGLSITDPCIGFDKTRAMILWANEYLQ